MEREIRRRLDMLLHLWAQPLGTVPVDGEVDVRYDVDPAAMIPDRVAPISKLVVPE